jgi:hypothetical protein
MTNVYYTICGIQYRALPVASSKPTVTSMCVRDERGCGNQDGGDCNMTPFSPLFHTANPP